MIGELSLESVPICVPMQWQSIELRFPNAVNLRGAWLRVECAEHREFWLLLASITQVSIVAVLLTNIRYQDQTPVLILRRISGSALLVARSGRWAEVGVK